jgi:hypothetical protein
MVDRNVGQPISQSFARFGPANMQVEEIKKIVWLVTDALIDTMKNKTEWMGTKIFGNYPP